MNLARTLACLATVLASTGASPAHAVTAQQGPYELELLVDGAPAHAYLHQGETWVLGRLGERYTLRVHNRSDRRIEAVVSVDGRDVVDGKPAEFRRKRGYLVEAWGTVDIDGWRVSQREAAAFRFSRVADSYAARTGSARNVGVIGVAVFPERWSPPPPPPRPLAGPADHWNREAPTTSPSPWNREAPTTSPSPWNREAPATSAERADAAPAPAAPASSAGQASSDDVSRRAAKSAAPRPGLGTEFGEAVASQVTEVPFERADRTSPSAVLGVRYDDRDGLLALGIPVDGPSWSDADLRRTASPFPSDGRFARPPPGWRR
jgi:hypothetical protein